tara:strand:+ start:612 stop:908 length:297 start_codon:yes stop_codon:yes gene_type:complete
MKGFWTCGPFKEAEDKLDNMIFRAEQMKVFLELLEESSKVDKIIENGTDEDKTLASLVKLDLDQKLQILLGIADEQQEEDDKVSREAILKSFEGISKN